MIVTVSLDTLWYKAPFEDRKQFAISLTNAFFKAYEDESDGGFRNAQRKLANREPACRKANESDCADTDSIKSDWEREIAAAAAWRMTSAVPHSTTIKVERRCTQYHSKDDWLAVNARQAVIYERTPFTAATWALAGGLVGGLPGAVYAGSSYASQAIPNGRFSLESLDAYLPARWERPCSYFIWVHGYFISDTTGDQRMRRIAERFRQAGGCSKLYAFKWRGDPFDTETAPKEAVLFNTPFGASQFNAAEEAADFSAPALAYFIKALHERDPQATIHLGGHSLGTRVILSALNELPAHVVDTVVLVEAAVPCIVFSQYGEFGPTLDSRGNPHGGVTSKVRAIQVVYNRHDDVLGKYYVMQDFAGYASTFGVPALGLIGPPPYFPPSFYLLPYPNLHRPPNVFATNMSNEWDVPPDPTKDPIKENYRICPSKHTLN